MATAPIRNGLQAYGARTSKRKAAVIAGLKAKIMKRKKPGNGFAYLFPATDDTIGEVTAFINRAYMLQYS